MFEKVLRPVLEDACGIRLDAHYSRHPGHIVQLLSEFTLPSYNGIIFVGGDGTVHEGLQASIDVAIHGFLDSGSRGCRPGFLSKLQWPYAMSMFAHALFASTPSRYFRHSRWLCACTRFPITQLFRYISGIVRSA